jgi:hypothetical protein
MTPSPVATPSVTSSPTATWTAAPFGLGASTLTPAVPTSSPTETPEGPPDFRAGRQLPFDLTGYGARVRIINLVDGSLPAIVDIDAATRRGMEQAVRYLEAYPGYVLPCPLGFLAYRYAAGQRFVLFLGLERNEWYTMVRLPLRGDRVLVTQTSLDYYTPSLVVGSAMREAFFADLPAENLPANSPGSVTIMSDKWLIESASVGLDVFAAAVRSVRSAPPASTSASDAGPPSIRPPDTGDGGLMGLDATRLEARSPRHSGAGYNFLVTMNTSTGHEMTWAREHWRDERVLRPRCEALSQTGFRVLLSIVPAPDAEPGSLAN